MPESRRREGCRPILLAQDRPDHCSLEFRSLLNVGDGVLLGQAVVVGEFFYRQVVAH